MGWLFFFAFISSKSGDNKYKVLRIKRRKEMTYIKALEAQVESYAAYLRREERSQSRAYNQSLDSGEDGIMGTLEISKIKYIWQSAMEQRRKPSRKAQAIWRAPPFLQAGKAPMPSYQLTGDWCRKCSLTWIRWKREVTLAKENCGHK